VTARTALLLTVTLVILIMLGARELPVAGDAPISSTAAGEKDTHLLPDMPGTDDVSATSMSRQDDDVYDAVDLYGNEVTAAVATYKLDGAGALYELHSPQTEVPQLAPPKS
jgi:hypothetical protein